MVVVGNAGISASRPAWNPLSAQWDVVLTVSETTTPIQTATLELMGELDVALSGCTPIQNAQVDLVLVQGMDAMPRVDETSPIPAGLRVVADDPCFPSLLVAAPPLPVPSTDSSPIVLGVSYDAGGSYYALDLGSPSTVVPSLSSVSILNGFLILQTEAADGGDVYVARVPVSGAMNATSDWIRLPSQISHLGSLPASCLPTGLLETPGRPSNGVAVWGDSLAWVGVVEFSSAEPRFQNISLLASTSPPSLYPLAAPVVDAVVDTSLAFVYILDSSANLTACPFADPDSPCTPLRRNPLSPAETSQATIKASGGSDGLFLLTRTRAWISRDVGVSWDLLLSAPCIEGLVASSCGGGGEFVFLARPTCGSGPRNIHYGSVQSKQTVYAGGVPADASTFTLCDPGYLRTYRQATSGSPLLVTADVPLSWFARAPVFPPSQYGNGPYAPLDSAFAPDAAIIPLGRDQTLIGPLKAAPDSVPPTAWTGTSWSGTGMGDGLLLKSLLQTQPVVAGSLAASAEPLVWALYESAWAGIAGPQTRRRSTACANGCDGCDVTFTFDDDAWTRVGSTSVLVSPRANMSFAPPSCGFSEESVGVGTVATLEGGAFHVSSLVAPGLASGTFFVHSSSTPSPSPVIKRREQVRFFPQYAAHPVVDPSFLPGETDATLTLSCVVNASEGLATLGLSPPLPSLEAQSLGLVFVLPSAERVYAQLVGADRAVISASHGCLPLLLGSGLAPGVEWEALASPSAFSGLDVFHGVGLDGCSFEETRVTAESRQLGNQSRTQTGSQVVLDATDSLVLSSSQGGPLVWEIGSDRWMGVVRVERSMNGSQAVVFPVGRGVVAIRVKLQSERASSPGSSHTLACASVWKTLWVLAGCASSKQLELRIPESPAGIEAGAVDVIALPVNYRPPSRLGKGVPLTANVYHGDPSAGRERNLFDVSKRTGRYKQCEGAQNRAECGCSQASVIQPSAASSDCMEVVPKVLFANRFTPVFSVLQNGLDERVYTGRYELREINNRTDWCTNSSRCDDQSVYELTASARDSIVWGGDELFHFEIRGLDPSFCSLKVEFAVWVSDPPIQLLELWSVITLTLVGLALGLLGLYIWHFWRTS